MIFEVLRGSFIQGTYSIDSSFPDDFFLNLLVLAVKKKVGNYVEGWGKCVSKRLME